MELVVKVFLAPFLGALLSFAYSSTLGMPIALLSFTMLFILLHLTISSTGRFFVSFLFHAAFVIVQHSFLLPKIANDWAAILLFIPLIGVFLPPSLSFFLQKRRFIELYCVVLLLSTYLFSVSSVGNPLIELWGIAGSIPWAIKWLQYTGPAPISLWILLMAYFSYRNIIYRKPKGLLILLVFLPVGVSQVIKEPSNKERSFLNMALISFSDSTSRERDYYKILSGDFSQIDYLLLPEGAIYVNSNQKQVSPSITVLKRLTSRYSNMSVITGVFSFDNEYMSNEAILLSESKNQVHYKRKLIPFVEYLPYKNLFGQMPFLAKRMLYPVKETSDENIDIFKGTRLPSIMPLICYEGLFRSCYVEGVSNGCHAFLVLSSNSYLDGKRMEKTITNFLRCYAIAMHRPIIRCVEHGISSFISDQGVIINHNSYKTEVLKQKIYYSGEDSLYGTQSNYMESVYFVFLLILCLFLCFSF